MADIKVSYTNDEIYFMALEAYYMALALEKATAANLAFLSKKIYPDIDAEAMRDDFRKRVAELALQEIQLDPKISEALATALVRKLKDDLHLP